MAIKFLNTATGITEAAGDNSTKIATTAYVDAAAAAIPIGNYLPLSAGATKPLTGSLYIPNYIYHVGDAGTFIGFPANDRLIIGTNGGTRVDITNSGFCLGDQSLNVSVSVILDEDNMASNSATALVTQQSIKAYVDAKSVGILTLASANGITVTGGTTANATVGVNYTAASNNLVHPATTITNLSQGTSYGTYFLCANSNPGITYGAVSKIRTGHMRLNDFGAPDGSVSMNAQKITNVATPTVTTDAANKAYVDNTTAPSVTFIRSGINGSTYTMLATVSGDRLASIIRMTMTGTSNSVVFACTFDITANHYKDIHVKSSNGDYVEVTLRITSNNNEDYSIEAKHNGNTTTSAEVCIFPLANETITPTTTDPGYTGAEYEHTATEGWRFGGEDGNVESSNVLIDGKLGVGGEVSFNSYGAGTLVTDASGNITSNSINHADIWFTFPGIATTASNRSDGWFSGKTVKYTKFQANFDNLILESGSTYKLILERFKKGQGDAYERSTARKSGYKRQLTGTGSYADAPYNARPVEIAITSLSQEFDFRPDLYYSGSNARGFPRPSGFSGAVSARVSSRQYFAFRISKTTSGVTEVSNVLAKLQLVGDSSDSQYRIAWKPYQ